MHRIKQSENSLHHSLRPKIQLLTMIDESHNPWTTLGSKEIYDNPWISVREDQIVNPSSGKGIYGVVHFKGSAVGIIPLDENGNTWLVGQYRYALGEYSWEIPEGGVSLRKDMLEGAKRELKEETGITADDWHDILHLAVSNSVTDQRAVIYLARKLSFSHSEPEETESLQVKKLPFVETYQMVMDGTITDAMSVAGILKLKVMIDRGEVKNRLDS